MRLFVALLPSPVTIAAVDAAVAPVRAARPELRWVAPQRWHVTLAFLGEVPDERRDDLEERLGRAARRAAPLRLTVDGAGRFGDRTLWARVDGDRERLRRLAEAAQAAAARARIPVDRTRFRAHLTLAAARPPASVRAAVAELDPLLRNGPEETVTRMCVVRSLLGKGPGGTPRYEPVAAWRLGDAR
ncbi:RNA 2',3'-cyclic phosphodiesterase [Pseudonocardia sulfidoxydans NBRC 16205]|uniref:RNA 2',3'-cyclic phosphodiesterase n=1 Tax=Pseudonocardia sulfidoxydans NBRC 16205 TaxID=1223511 RepID=A0A511DN82_9PSEU|nr:RNA 2',3'-cyclic phosphodiesterase [Pseudonocardia sulfidoxydans]GEL26270.1 RNA 2',3'-cyclic phosphodiesterase [Pseudonocardia sulfidoxydans NBRC 16205]